MILLALDTCDSRGSIALLRDGATLGEVSYPPDHEFSSWLLPAVDNLLGKHSLSHADLAGYAVASGPGSFTGVRIGLTTAKAWSEVYGKPIFPVSRLAILADRAPESAAFAATFIDAQRKQIFAGLYRRDAGTWISVKDDAVIDPSEFFRSALQIAGRSSLAWVSLDPGILSSNPMWNTEIAGTAPIVAVEPPLAAAIGLHATTTAAHRHDALSLDANYVRRSDAEIFGKKAAGS
ncbi:MAG: hypothetical protein NVS9B14_11770 [Candidatus Acidiferrum sp.]